MVFEYDTHSVRFSIVSTSPAKPWKITASSQTALSTRCKSKFRSLIEMSQCDWFFPRPSWNLGGDRGLAKTWGARWRNWLGTGKRELIQNLSSNFFPSCMQWEFRQILGRNLFSHCSITWFRFSKHGNYVIRRLILLQNVQFHYATLFQAAHESTMISSRRLNREELDRVGYTEYRWNFSSFATWTPTTELTHM